ncbi:MAG: cysteine hydrolase, partial [Gammaproteobacteria bacterium]
RARELLLAFRQRQGHIVHVQHLSARPGATFFLPDTDGVEINEVVKPDEGETVVQKNFPNSFRDTELLAQLQRADVAEVIICGAMSHMCIDATTRAAFDFGFRCTVVEDACATRDLEHKGETIRAADVHASFMAALAVPYARVVSASEFIAKKGSE